MSQSINQVIRSSWTGDSPQEEAARARLLDATDRCLARDGVAATSVASIAEEAGVSRQTVYRYFEGKDDLARHAVKRAAEEVRRDIGAALRSLRDPADMVVEALVIGIEEVRDGPVLRAVWDASSDGSIASWLTTPVGIDWMAETLAPAVEAAGWSASEASTRLEMMLRLFVSFLVSPEPRRSDDELRAFLYRHLVPGLGLGEGSAR